MSDPQSVEPQASTSSGVDAAQGRTGSRTFIILIVSIALVLLAMFAAFAFNSHGLNAHQGVGGQTGVKGAAANSFNAPAEAAPKQNAPTNATAPGTH